MKTMVVYSIRVWDGGDRCNHRFYLASKEEAEKWVKENNFDSYWEEVITVYDTIEERETHIKNGAKKRALAKLTEEERKALGF